jgi:acetyltransferase EpsM
MYLLGASGHAKVILDILKRNSISVKGFFDDNLALTTFGGMNSLGPVSKSEKTSGKFIISIGSNRVRQKIANSLKLEFISAIHPTAIIDETVIVEEGTVVMAGAIVNVDCTIGRHVIINTGAVVDHDCVIGDFAHLSPNSTLSGNVSVGEGTHIGSGAVVIPGVEIGKWATVGAGTVVIKNVPDGATVVGSPARRVK